MATINQTIDTDTATLVVEELGHKVKLVSEDVRRATRGFLSHRGRHGETCPRGDDNGACRSWQNITTRLYSQDQSDKWRRRRALPNTLGPIAWFVMMRASLLLILQATPLSLLCVLGEREY